MKKADVTAIVLAGGKATRMHGVQKAFFNYHGKPLIEHVLSRLEEQVGQIIISGTRDLEPLAARYQLVADEQNLTRGPLTGIRSCLAVCITPVFVTVPCDSPLVPSDLVQRLSRELDKVAHDLVVAHDGQRWQNLFMMGRTQAMLSHLRQRCSKEFAVWRWIKEVNATPVDFSDCAASFLNINAEADVHSGLPRT